MKYIEQDDGPTCGVACYAMIMNKSFKESYTILKDSMNYGGLTTKDLIIALRKKYKISQNRLRPVGNKTWSDLPKLCLIKVRPDDCPNHHWHWVVLNKNKVYDPDLGVFNYKHYMYDPISFLEIGNEKFL